VAIPQEIQYSRLSFRDDAALHLNFDRSAYLRTVGHLLQNISTSAWITDEYMIMPFWPSSQQDTAPLGPFVVSTASQTWQGTTTVLNTELDCQQMSLQAMGHEEMTFPNVPEMGDEKTMSPVVSLVSDSGCNFTSSLYSSYGMVLQGGGYWAPLDQFVSAGWNLTFGDGTHDAFRIWYTDQCGSPSDHEMLMVSTASLPNDPTDGGGGSVVNVPLNYDFLSNFTVNAQLCSPSYYIATDVPVTAAVSPSASNITFDMDQYRQSRSPISSSLFSTDQFQHAVLNYNWTYYFTVARGCRAAISWWVDKRAWRSPGL
jgi:hypothetical protein